VQAKLSKVEPSRGEDDPSIAPPEVVLDVKVRRKSCFLSTLVMTYHMP
jgi:hypothetical protein